MIEDQDVVEDQEEEELNEPVEKESESPEETEQEAPKTEEQDGEEQSEESKTYTQAEVEYAVEKKRKQLRRKMERDLALQKQELEAKYAAANNQVVEPEPFNHDGTQNVAFHVQQELARARAIDAQEKDILIRTQQQKELLLKVDLARDKYEDFEDTVDSLDDEGVITGQMQLAIKEHINDMPEFVYKVAKSYRDDLKRISQLPSNKQVKEMILLEAKVSAKHPPKKVTKAPAPPKKINSSGSAGSLKDPAKMSFERRVQMLRNKDRS